MFNFRKYILRIILLLFSIFLFCFFLKEKLIKNFSHNFELNSFILLVFFLGVGIAFKNIIILNKEQIWLNNFFNEKRVRLEYDPKILGDLKNLNQTDIFFSEKIKNITERVIEKLDNERELLKYFTTLLVFLGLIGTFWGLLKL